MTNMAIKLQLLRVIQHMLAVPFAIGSKGLGRRPTKSLSKLSSPRTSESASTAPTTSPHSPRPLRVLVPNPHPGTGTVVVVGQPRGGTSVIAGLCHLIGATMGADIDPSNMEDRTFLGILSAPDRQLALKQAVKTLDRLGPFRGFKDPLVIEYLDDLLLLLENPILVFVLRDVVAIAERESIEGSEFLLALATSDARRRKKIDLLTTGSLNGIPHCVISYERALAEPQTAFSQLSDFLAGATDAGLRSAARRLVVPNARMPEDINFVEIAKLQNH